MISSRAARSVSRPKRSSCPRTLGMLSNEKLSSLPSAGRSSSIPAIRGGGESLTGHAEASTGTGTTRRSESSDSCSRSGSRTGHVQRTMSTSSPNGDSLISIAMASASTASSNGTGKRGELLKSLACSGLVGQPTTNQGQVVPHGRGIGHFGRQSGQAIGRFLPLGLLQGSNGRFELRPPGGIGRARQHRADRSSAAWESRRND